VAACSCFVQCRSESLRAVISEEGSCYDRLKGVDLSWSNSKYSFQFSLSAQIFFIARSVLLHSLLVLFPAAACLPGPCVVGSGRNFCSYQH